MFCTKYTSNKHKKTDTKQNTRSCVWVKTVLATLFGRVVV